MIIFQIRLDSRYLNFIEENNIQYQCYVEFFSNTNKCVILFQQFRYSTPIFLKIIISTIKVLNVE